MRNLCSLLYDIFTFTAENCPLTEKKYSWGEWGPWSGCTKTCLADASEISLQYRIRTCIPADCVVGFKGQEISEAIFLGFDFPKKRKESFTDNTSLRNRSNKKNTYYHVNPKGGGCGCGVGGPKVPSYQEFVCHFSHALSM